MIYIYSKLDLINNYFQKEFGNKYKITSINSSFFDFNNEFQTDDIVILDITDFETVDDILEYFNTIPKNLRVIALVDEAKLAQGAYLIKKGFKSYLSVRTNKVIIEQVINTVKNGNVWLYPELMNYIIKHININSDENRSSDSLDKLSKKEKQVANYVADGMSNKEIAQSLGVQLVTIKKHISSIFSKLNIKDRVALAILIRK